MEALKPGSEKALAQLLDYARFSPEPLARIAALFPQQPDHHGVGLLHQYGIDCIYLDDTGSFVRLPAPVSARRRWQALTP